MTATTTTNTTTTMMTMRTTTATSSVNPTMASSSLKATAAAQSSTSSSSPTPQVEGEVASSKQQYRAMLTDCPSSVSTTSTTTATASTTDTTACTIPMTTLSPSTSFLVDVEDIAEKQQESSSSGGGAVAAVAVATDDAEQHQQDQENMKDEYGAMDCSGHTYTYEGDFLLESGQTLPNAQLRYQTYGTMNEQRTNVLVVCHALTGNASLHAWWGELLGPNNKTFDTSRYFVVCCNILGSPYGSTAPTSIDPRTGQQYGLGFPDVSVRDTVRLQLLLLKEELRVRSVFAVIGGSFGGMQALEFAIQAGICSRISTDNDDDDNRGTSSSMIGNFVTEDGSPFVKRVVVISAGAQHTAWQIGISEVQRLAIYSDAAWQNGKPFDATQGLAVARQMAMISYRTAAGYQRHFGRSIKQAQRGAQNNNDTNNGSSKNQETKKNVVDVPYGTNAHWQVKSYLEYQGEKFLTRFDPVTYVKLTEQMDSHDIARERRRCFPSSHGGAGNDDVNVVGGVVADVLSSVDIPVLVLGIDSDVLYPIQEQQTLAQYLPNSTFGLIRSVDGHDGFLLEQDQIAEQIGNFLRKQQRQRQEQQQ